MKIWKELFIYTQIILCNAASSAQEYYCTQTNYLSIIIMPIQNTHILTYFFSSICGREVFLIFEHRLFLSILCICPLVIVNPCSQSNEFLFIALPVYCHYCRLFLLLEGCFVSCFWKAILRMCLQFIGLYWSILFWHIQCSPCKFEIKKRIFIQLWTSSHSGKYYLLLTPFPQEMRTELKITNRLLFAFAVRLSFSLYHLQLPLAFKKTKICVWFWT